ncbi:MAG: NAD(P)/FAD-dependent oxidoreductase [Saprospiraceae bacterium]|nr:NAD(P)/FAD-dependent oxidoreductase [Saprospiraceae bacterium]
MRVAIIGNGIAGITAARWIRKLSDKAHITVISDEGDYFFSRTALMYIYMGHMRLRDTQPYEPWFWEKNRIQLLRGRVETIDFHAKSLKFKEKDDVHYDKLIIATGSKSNKFGWRGQDLDGVHGLYHLQDLAAMERHTATGIQRAVVVGGGLIGIEMAEMFHSRHIPVTFLVRESSFWNNILPPEESAMINRHILEHGIDLRLGRELDYISDKNNDGKVDTIQIKDCEELSCQFVGLTVGVSPNIDFLRNSPLSINRGIKVNNFLETNQPDVYAIGDCAELDTPEVGRRPIEAIWYTGKMMGEVVAYNVIGRKTAYKPRLWFNSAKFFDIEYQVYGDIRAALPPEHETIYWEHADGKCSIRINFDKNTEGVVGFNLMGIRYRHEVCEKWILAKTPIETVLKNLGLANFDPEFYREYEQEVVRTYNQKFNKSLQLKTKRGLNAVTRFLETFK